MVGLGQPVPYLVVDLLHHAVIVPPSIGIALSRAGADEPDELVEAADAAMYAAKQQGRGLA